tara:strand:+ start:1033 stop:1704 length:672 start_codon:yes stop_codon:yes gene_type:complete
MAESPLNKFINQRAMLQGPKSFESPYNILIDDRSQLKLEELEALLEDAMKESKQLTLADDFLGPGIDKPSSKRDPLELYKKKIDSQKPDASKKTSKVAKEVAKKSKMGMFLKGAGVLGNVLLLYELLAGATEAGNKDANLLQDLRAGSTGRTERSLGNLLQGDQRRLDRSDNLRSLSAASRIGNKISPELAEIIEEGQMKELLKSRHKASPSVKEAYARAGLL